MDTCTDRYLGLIAAFRQAWGAIATTVVVTVLENKLTTEIPSHVIPAALGAGLPESSLPALFLAIAAGFTPASLAAVKGATPAILAAVQDAVLVGSSAAYAYVFYTGIAFSGFVLVCTCFSMDYDPLFNDHVSRQVYKHNGIPGEANTHAEGADIPVAEGTETTEKEQSILA